MAAFVHQLIRVFEAFGSLTMRVAIGLPDNLPGGADNVFRRTLKEGLRFAGYRSFKANDKTLIERFDSIYGCSPIAFVNLWYDLRYTVVPGSDLLPLAANKEPKSLFLGLRWARMY
jgi:hypothetical protein